MHATITWLELVSVTSGPVSAYYFTASSNPCHCEDNSTGDPGYNRTTSITRRVRTASVKHIQFHEEERAEWLAGNAEKKAGKCEPLHPLAGSPGPRRVGIYHPQGLKRKQQKFLGASLT